MLVPLGYARATEADARRGGRANELWTPCTMKAELTRLGGTI